MAETTDTAPVVETEVPAELTGAACLALVSGADTLGHLAEITWQGDQVTFRRRSSGRGGESVETARDTVTESALLSLIVPGVRTVPDFKVHLFGTTRTDRPLERGVTLEVRNGTATLQPLTDEDAKPAALPRWLLDLLYALVFDDESDAA